MMLKTAPERAGTVVATEDEPTRGTRIQNRRKALGLFRRSQFAEASGFNYDLLGRIEADNASEASFEQVEAWLDRMESAQSAGATAAPAASAVRVQLHDVFGVGEVEVIFEGDTPADEMAEKMRALISGLRPGPQPPG